MDASEIDAENALVADLLDLAVAVQLDAHNGAGIAVWMQWREQIAVLRQRVQVMRTRHLESRLLPRPASGRGAVRIRI